MILVKKGLLIWNTPHANWSQNSMKGEYCENGRGVTYIQCCPVPASRFRKIVFGGLFKASGVLFGVFSPPPSKKCYKTVSLFGSYSYFWLPIFCLKVNFSVSKNYPDKHHWAGGYDTKFDGVMKHLQIRKFYHCQLITQS